MRIRFQLERDEQYDPEYSDSPISESAIRQLESSIGLTFPDAYREFLSTCNGGSFRQCVFPSSPIGPLIVVSFFSVDGANGDRVDFVYSNMRELLPASCLPFAVDPGGNVFYLDMADGGRVHFWDHGTRGRHRLAEGFEEFVRSLIPDD